MTYPLTIIYPAGAAIAAPPTWQHLPDGRLAATYHTYEELYWSVTLSLWLKDLPPLPKGEGRGEGKGETPPHQIAMFAPANKNAAYNL